MIRRTIDAAFAALTLLLSASPAMAQQSPDAFAQMMIGRIEALEPDLVLTRDPNDPLTVQRGEGDDAARIYFHRLYQYCSANDAEACEVEVANFARFAVAPQSDRTKARENMRLVVRNSEYVAYMRSMETDESHYLIEPIGEDLYALLAFDSPDAIMYAPIEDLADLDITPVAAWLLAFQQTSASLPPLPSSQALRDGQAHVFADQDFLASMLVDRAAWAKIADAVGPDLFVTIVADRLLFVGTMPPGPGLESFRASVAEDCAQQPRCLSPHIYRFRDGQWVIDQPPGQRKQSKWRRSN